MDDKLLSTRQLAEYLQISNQTLERKRTDGTGPIFTKIGHRVVYSEKNIQKWLTEQERCSTAEYS